MALIKKLFSKQARTETLLDIEIYKSKETNDLEYRDTNNKIVKVGTRTFLALSDTPFAGQGNKVVSVSVTEDKLEYSTIPTQVKPLDQVLTDGNTTGNNDIVYPNIGAYKVRWGNDASITYDDNGDAYLECASQYGVVQKVTGTNSQAIFDGDFQMANANAFPHIRFTKSTDPTRFGRLYSSDLTSQRTWTLPDASGTIALTTDIPASQNLGNTNLVADANQRTYKLLGNLATDKLSFLNNMGGTLFDIAGDGSGGFRVDGKNIYFGTGSRIVTGAGYTTGSLVGFSLFNCALSNSLQMQGQGMFGGSHLQLISGGTDLDGDRTIAIQNGTVPSLNRADTFKMYSDDITPGNAAPHFRTENGEIIKLYRQDLNTTPTLGEIATFLESLGLANLI